MDKKLLLVMAMISIMAMAVYTSQLFAAPPEELPPEEPAPAENPAQDPTIPVLPAVAEETIVLPDISMGTQVELSMQEAAPAASDSGEKGVTTSGLAGASVASEESQDAGDLGDITIEGENAVAQPEEGR